MRSISAAVLALVVLCTPACAQTRDTTTHDKTFLTRRDLAVSAIALAATGLVSVFDDDIARTSQEKRFQDSSLHRSALRVSKVNETTLTVAGIAAYGLARLFHAPTATDIALHATESVILSSLASQVIRGPLGRARPYVTRDSDQYDFQAFAGFKRGSAGFDRRAFPSIHTSSAMAVATVLTMEMQRRHYGATPFVAPVLVAAGLLPGIARIQLDQHWASDVAAGAFMGVLAGYKVVSYSHDHPNNRFDEVLLKASIAPDPNGGARVGFSLF